LRVPGSFRAPAPTQAVGAGASTSAP
jgi:hypothetical protein